MEGNFPKNIAIIMDGNGRWAQRQDFKIRYGHKRGAESFIRIVNYCLKIGVESLTVFAFSTENWKRPPSEIGALMRLLKYYMNANADKFYKSNIKLKVIGASLENKIDKDILDKIKEVEEKTKDNKFALNVAFNYGGRREIVDASKKIAEDVKNNIISVDDIDENTFKKYLYNPDIAYPDLIIRTGGVLRLSNFLLWEMSYSELYFTDTLWPDFDEKQLDLAIEDFKHRVRTYGERKAKR
ncbi:MAG: di-trans,poly-cis-decaprenylcistransferase [Rickettsiales bacterium]|nr:di-trans,poly-cis-decaprenylcistransferase [Rickettsiales bacterium]